MLIITPLAELTVHKILARTVSLRIADEVSGHSTCVGPNEDIGPELRVEAGEHLLELGVVEVGGSHQLRRAFPRPAPHGQLGRHTAEWPCARNQHPSCSKLVHPLYQTQQYC